LLIEPAPGPAAGPFPETWGARGGLLAARDEGCGAKRSGAL